MNENYLNIIKKNVTDIRHSLPSGVLLVAAAKTRLPDEVKAAIEAGIKAIGYNYVQEAERLHETIGTTVQWHMIGHLQRNKVKKAVMLFDMIETIDSVNLAEEVNKHCALESKVMPVLIEINSGKESNKTGVLPKVNPDICTGCGICIENCPMQAIELNNGKAFINEAECTNCRLCESECPVGAIN
jgi:hypothetical protein